MFDRGRAAAGSRLSDPRGSNGGGGPVGRGGNVRGGGEQGQARRVGGGGGARGAAVVRSLAPDEGLGDEGGADRMLRKGKLGEVLYRTAARDVSDGGAGGGGQRKGPRVLGWGREGGK